MRHVLSTALVAVIVGSLAGVTAGTLAQTQPETEQSVTPAATVANSDKVDGRHAVGYPATKFKRAGKLVATNSRGHLPNNIIRKARDADRLDGQDSTAFATRSELNSSAGSVNQSGNPVHWNRLIGVPSQIADGTDEVGYRTFIYNYGVGINAGQTRKYGTNELPRSRFHQFQLVPIATSDGGGLDLMAVETVRMANGNVKYVLTIRNAGSSVAQPKVRVMEFFTNIASASVTKVNLAGRGPK